MTNAFALGRLAAIIEFHLSRRGTNAPGRPFQSLPPPLRPAENGTAVLFHHSMRRYPGAPARFEHSNFFKVNGRPPGPLSEERHAGESRRDWGRCDAENAAPGEKEETAATRTNDSPSQPRRALVDVAPPRDPTTSFLTAAALIYAIGAGITAAAGTRLALRWVVAVRGLDCAHSDRGARLETRIVISRHYLPVPGVGKLRACCLPWMW